jgi:hypothetical protein
MNGLHFPTFSANQLPYFDYTQEQDSHPVAIIPSLSCVGTRQDAYWTIVFHHNQMSCSVLFEQARGLAETLVDVNARNRFGPQNLY